MKWERGDFGRFKAESNRLPRFELLGATKDRQYILVWYSGSRRATKVPIETFRHDCVDWWLTKANVPVATWLIQGMQIKCHTPWSVLKSYVQTGPIGQESVLNTSRSYTLIKEGSYLEVTPDSGKSDEQIFREAMASATQWVET